MAIRLGDIAPDFTAQTTEGPIHFHEWLGDRGNDVVILPSVPDADIPSKFPKGHTVIKPYLRVTPQP